MGCRCSPGEADGAVQRLRHDLVAVARRLFDSGMASGTSGNISSLVPGTRTILVKRTGVCLGDAVPGDFLLVDLDGNLLAGEGKPSKECRFHAGIYKVRPDVGAVIHDHSPYATAFSIMAEELPLVTVTARLYLGHVPRVPALPPGSPELARAIADTFSDPALKAVLMQAHGVTVVGPDIVRASHLAGLLEDAARIAYLVRQASQ